MGENDRGILQPRCWHKPFRELSAGKQWHAAIAQLLATKPEILLLDEPGNYLDLEF